MENCETCELMLDELAQINSLLDRLHGDVYDFHNISAVDALRQLVNEHEVWDKHSLVEIVTERNNLRARVEELEADLSSLKKLEALHRAVETKKLLKAQGRVEELEATLTSVAEWAATLSISHSRLVPTEIRFEIGAALAAEPQERERRDD